MEPRRRPLGIELVFAILVAAAVLLPGIWRYSLVDPWETHYGEVSRMMLQNHDWVHTEWPQDAEGFRSKPVLMFWMEAASMRMTGVARDGGYSGEMESGGAIMFAIRAPFVLAAIAGLSLMWFMLARLVSRRVAWLAMLVVGSCPFFCLVARQAIPDMPLLACVIGCISLLLLALEDGERPLEPLFHVRRWGVDARHLLFLVAGGFVALQALYYAYYFTVCQMNGTLAIRNGLPPNVVLPAIMFLALVALSGEGWLLVRMLLMPLAVICWGVAKATGLARPLPKRSGLPFWEFLLDHWLPAFERYMPDRLLIRALAYPIVWASALTWAQTDGVADRLLRMRPIQSARQVYLLWFYWLLGVSILAKGPPGLAVVGLVAFFHVLLLNRWRDLYEGAFELKRGLIFLTVTFLPWHVAMWWRDGNGFVNEYLYTHILNRATVGVDDSPQTFAFYTSQLGHGMWIWAALLPGALAAAFVRARLDTREGRVRFMIALWAITSIAFFFIVQTKFHHYILPAVPALAILVAFFLDDLVAKRERFHPLLAILGIGIALLICRDLMFEPKKWIEMFIFRYDRPWPAADPWFNDPSDAFLGLGIAAAVAIGAIAVCRKVGVALVGLVGLAICVWAQLVYMPEAGQHWGMRETIKRYYDQRQIYGDQIIYWSTADALDDWKSRGDTVHVESYLPSALTVGQPMSVTVVIRSADDKSIQETYTLVGTCTAIGDHDFTLTLAKGERERLIKSVTHAGAKPSGRAPLEHIDADKLIAWQLYWRGENFWTADEINGPYELKTAYKKADNADFLKYLNDRSKAPLGRRYYLVTEAGRITSVRSLLPTQRARDSFEVIDTTSSNKYSLAAFYL